MKPIRLIAAIACIFCLVKEAVAQDIGADDAPRFACPALAKACPDGSFVTPAGPLCEFAPCPGEADKGHGPSMTICNMGPVTCPDGTQVLCAPCPPSAASGGTGSVSLPARMAPGMPQGLSSVSDEPLTVIPGGPQSVEFVIEHRSALNGEQIILQGIIISTLLGERACPSDPMMGMPCTRPHIVLADSDSSLRDTRYDITVLLPQGDLTPYETGQTIDVAGTVMAGPSRVTLKEDEAE
jgi:hypothetical protein